MLFPEVQQRAIYKNNPLIEVVCQFRYPTILLIDAQKPVEFQEEIRREFPDFREKRMGFQISQEVAQLIPEEIIGSLRSDQKAYEFATLDNNWVISLTQDFVALTNSEYVRWEEFRAKLETPFKALSKIYAPAAFIRVGLRYKNLIQRSVLGLEGVEWSELINPVLAGFLSSPQHSQLIGDTTHITLLKSDDGLGKVRIRYGLSKNEQTGETCYLIDSDFFSEGIEDVENGLEIIADFNRRNRNLFRWCISDFLHESMEPTAI